jgi:hypothetical protein
MIAAAIEGLDLTVSANDQMASDFDEYIAAGRTALSLCQTAMRTKVPRRIIDFPSGHGRVARWIKREWLATRRLRMRAHSISPPCVPRGPDPSRRRIRSATIAAASSL